MSISVATLAIKLETGLYSFNQLSENERVFLINFLQPVNGFTQEQQDFFKQWRLIVPSGELNKIDQLCQGRSIKFSAQQLNTNQWVIGIDLLTDVRKEGNYEHAYQWITELKIRRVQSSDFK